MTPPPTAAALWRDLDFLRLWGASTAAGLAHWAFPFALGVAAAQGRLDLAALGLILALRTVGFLAAVPVAGVLADRYPRRLVLRIAGGAAALATIPAALTMDSSVVVCAAAAAVIGAGQGSYRPALQALIAQVVDAERRQAANAANSLAVRVSVLLGPALVTGASRVLDIRLVIGAIALLWAAAALLPPSGGAVARASAARPAEPARPADAPTAHVAQADVRRTALLTLGGGDPQDAVRRKPLGGALRAFGADLAEGVAEARRHPWFPAGLGALCAVIMLGYSATSVALPLISKERFEGDVVLAAGVTAYTVGAIVGAALVARWRPRHQGWWAMGGLALYALVPLTLAFSPWPALIVAAYVLAGLGIEVFNVPWFTAAQREVAPDKLARVSSLDFLVSYGLAPLGLALLAPAMASFGASAVLTVCALVCVVAPAATVLVPQTRDFAERPTDESLLAEAPTVGPAPAGASGMPPREAPVASTTAPTDSTPSTTSTSKDDR